MSSFVEIRTEDAHRIIIIIMIRRRGRRGSWWLVLVVVSERGKMLMAVLALCCCAGLVAATPTEDPCPLGFYHVEELCCELCKPGQFVLFECMKNNGPSTCLECPNGYYTAMANHLSGCLKCTPCDEDEDVDQPCTGSSDTLCRCKAGFQRADDGLCSSTGGGKTAGIVVSVVLLLMLVAAAAAAFIYKMKGGRFPCDSIEVKLIKDNRAEIIRLVCDDPGSLLDEVESLGYKNVYSRVIAQKKECQGERLIDEMISLGQKACQDLIRALEAVQDKYEGLQQLLDMILTPTSGRRQDDYGSAGRLLDRKPSASEYDADERESQTTTQPDGPDGNQRGAADPNGHRLNYNEYVEGEPGNSNQQELAALGLLNAKAPIPETGPCAEKAPGRDANVHYSTTPAGEVAANEEAFRRLTACSDEQLLDGIKKNMMALVEAIEGDVRPVLTKLFEKEIFTIAEMNAVSTTQTNKSGSEAASQLITMLLHKGDRVAREFWMALWNLKTNYPRMPKIFENVLLIIEPAV
ncbi:uncharacterized protein LOC133359534 isoform X3 [Lethenteron reissneri]|uniref:uncharacterized protein LOC133359534 isoform X3 n=1 Tax=Lethenteron reissneri TaxID=7753 RepID=UPI002AB72064|nr:uncharacterized protein LOC133359534 isoform X3 [Lethenteron reissneri]